VDKHSLIVRQRRNTFMQSTSRDPFTPLQRHRMFTTRFILQIELWTKTNFRTFREPIYDKYRNCSAYSEPMTPHALGRQAGSRQTLLHIRKRSAGERHGRYLESMTCYQKSDSVSRCLGIFTRRTILSNSILIRFEKTEALAFMKSDAPTATRRTTTAR